MLPTPAACYVRFPTTCHTTFPRQPRLSSAQRYLGDFDSGSSQVRAPKIRPPGLILMALVYKSRPETPNPSDILRCIALEIFRIVTRDFFRDNQGCLAHNPSEIRRDNLNKPRWPLSQILALGARLSVFEIPRHLFDPHLLDRVALITASAG